MTRRSGFRPFGSPRTRARGNGAADEIEREASRSVGAVAVLPLAAAAAGARVVAAAASVLVGVELDDLGRCAALRQPLGHVAHRPVDVVEKVLEAGAEIVEAGLPVRRVDEAILWTTAVAREADVALEAVQALPRRPSSATTLRTCPDLLRRQPRPLDRDQQAAADDEPVGAP